MYDNESLPSFVRSRGIRGDIYTLVAYLITGQKDHSYLQSKLNDSKTRIVDILKIEVDKRSTNRSNKTYNSWLKDFKKVRSKFTPLSNLDLNPVLPESTLDGYINLPHQSFIDDGISTRVQKKFEVGFDIATERVTIPIRDKHGNLIGVKGRSTRENEIAKYLSLYPFKKAQELYNFHNARSHILDKNEIIIVEGEKSVMKMWDMKYYHVCASMGADITNVQAEIIQQISPNLKIIIAYDADKTISEIKEVAKSFTRSHNNVYAIYDTDGLLNEKDSPCDQGLKVWETLYKNNNYKIFAN